MQRITPCLWFDTEAEQAVKFYTSIFKKSKVIRVSYYGETSEQRIGRRKGSVMTIDFELEGQRFMALNGGPEFKFNEALSLMVYCKTQSEVDRYWKKLSAGGREVQCGWLKDKFGVFWQIVPTILTDLIASKDAAKSDRVMKAMFDMVKLDIKKLKDAAKGEGKNSKKQKAKSRKV